MATLEEVKERFENVNIFDSEACKKAFEEIQQDIEIFASKFHEQVKLANDLVNKIRLPKLKKDKRSLAKLEEMSNSLSKSHEDLTELLCDSVQYDDSINPLEDCKDPLEDIFNEYNKEFSEACYTGLLSCMSDINAANDKRRAQEAIEIDLESAEMLKPKFKLSFKHKPLEQKEWMEDFYSYCRISRILDSTPEVGQVFLRRFLCRDVWVRIKMDFDSDTPVWSPDKNVETCLSILEKHFLVHYPLIRRRMEFFNLRQKQGQSSSSFLSDLKRFSEVAKAEDMTSDDIVVVIFLNGLNSESMRQEIVHRGIMVKLVT